MYQQSPALASLPSHLLLYKLDVDLTYHETLPFPYFVLENNDFPEEQIALAASSVPETNRTVKLLQKIRDRRGDVDASLWSSVSRLILQSIDDLGISYSSLLGYKTRIDLLVLNFLT